MAQEARAMLLKHRPELSNKLEELPGYAVIAMTATKIPGVGTGLGYGVIKDNRNQQSSYIRVTQFEVGGGIGAQKFKTVILLEDASLVDRMIKGGLHYESSAEFGATSEKSGSDGTLSTQSGKGYKVFKLTESGALATITVRVLQAKPYLSN
jgi:lipid-binding SYLF domain-containing protein